MNRPHLRVTQRCLEDDLQLDVDLSRDARGYCAQHEILRTFVVKRGAAPGVGEPIKGIAGYPRYLSLHSGRTRGATFWDEEADVCWLLAYKATHATHEARDVYKHFMRLGERGELLPTADDYEQLDNITVPYLIDGLIEMSTGLYEEARLSPRTTVVRSFLEADALIVVDVLVLDDEECEQGWLAIAFPQSTPLTPDDVPFLISALLPDDVNFDTLELTDTFDDRKLQAHELCWTWSLYPEA